MRIHRNLHNAKAGGPQWVETKGGKVQQYLDSVALLDVSTRIQPAGQRKCQETNVRSVCAFFDGELTDVPGLRNDSWLRVEYDPRVDDTFKAVSSTGVRYPWNRAAAAHLCADGSTWVLNPTLEV